jgi:transposase-like protein
VPERRKVDRPPYTHLVREIAAIGYEATARRYGVSGPAIRKWLRQYEREQERESQPSRLSRAD